MIYIDIWNQTYITYSTPGLPVCRCLEFESMTKKYIAASTFWLSYIASTAAKVAYIARYLAPIDILVYYVRNTWLILWQCLRFAVIIDS